VRLLERMPSFSRIGDSECLLRVLEAAGPDGAARVSASAVALAASPHVEAYWRIACLNASLDDDQYTSRSVPSAPPGGDSASWRSLFVARHGVAWARGARKRKLQAALGEQGLQLRSDSALCARFIELGASSVPGGLLGVVNTMAEMNFFFRETCYAAARIDLVDEVHERAHEDAAEAFRAGEDEVVDPEVYVEQPSQVVLSELAKDIALREYTLRAFRAVGPLGASRARSSVREAAENFDIVLERLQRAAPESLHVRLQALCEEVVRGDWRSLERPFGQSLRSRLYPPECDPEDADPEDATPSVPARTSFEVSTTAARCAGAIAASLPSSAVAAAAAVASTAVSAARRRRARLRERSSRVRSELELRLAPHVRAIRELDALRDATRTTAVVRFPPTLTREERAFLHRLAGQLDLQHGSVGEGSQRRLVVSAAFNAWTEEEEDDEEEELFPQMLSTFTTVSDAVVAIGDGAS